MTDEITILPLSAGAAKWVAENYDYGDIVAKQALWEKLEVPTPSLEDQKRMTFDEMGEISIKRMSLVEDTRSRLLKDYLIMLYTVRCVGYKLILPEEQAEVVLETMDKKISKHLRRAKRGLNCTRVELLNQQEQQSHEIARQRVSALKSMANRERRLFKAGPKELTND
jgi:hypothetical protein